MAAGVDDHRGGRRCLGIPDDAHRTVHRHPLRLPRALGRWRLPRCRPVARHQGPGALRALDRRAARAVGAAAAVVTARGRWQVVAIAGSVRRDSLNRRLVEAAAECAPEDIELCVYRGLGELPPFNEDLETCAFTAGPVRALCDQVRAAQGLLIATPEYNHSVPGVLKNAIDWLSRPSSGEALTGNPVAVVVANAGRWWHRLAQAAQRHGPVATAPLIRPRPAHP